MSESGRVKAEGGQRRRVAGKHPDQAGEPTHRLELRGRVASIEATTAGVKVVLDLFEQELSVMTSWTAVEWLGLAPGRVAALSIDAAAIGLTQLPSDAPSN